MNCVGTHICSGDKIVVHVSENLRYIFKIENDAQIQTKFGMLKAADLVGHPYGVKFNCKKGWILPLKLTPELWTHLLPHRTQILYQADVSMILLQLDIKPGSMVVESGTGSGSLSHAILRACFPHGFLHTFDINESRVQHAQQEFLEHGFANNVKTSPRNICELGFPPELEGKADACILDLPQTWSAIEHAHKVLKPDGSRLCAFSPCIEQVQRNVAKMTELKMKDIVTMECLVKKYDVKSQQLRLWNDDVLQELMIVYKKRLESLKNTLHQNKQAKYTSFVSDLDPEKPISIGMIHNPEGDNLEPLMKAITDPKAPFHPSMLPKQSHTHPKQFRENVSHSGFLTFATKRP